MFWSDDVLYWEDGATTDLFVANKLVALQGIYMLAQTRLDLLCHCNAMTDSCQLGGIRGCVSG